MPAETVLVTDRRRAAPTAARPTRAGCPCPARPAVRPSSRQELS
ncbi:hypothetical protein [Streptomyces sp. NPDC093094]